MRIFLDFRKQEEVVSLEIEVLSHALAQAWAKELYGLHSKYVKIAEKERIYNLNDEWSKQRISKELNECIDTINAWKPFIDDRVSITPQQDELNRLHLYFEKLIGLDGQRSEYYLAAPHVVRVAIRQLNVLIHRFESFRRHGRVVVTFEEKNRKPIPEEDFKLFTLSHAPGAVLLNYCHVGKPIFDFFKDEDDHITPENILPQHQWCADFIVEFSPGPETNEDFRLLMERKWIEHADLLRGLGIERDNPRSAFGRIQVGRIVEDAQGQAFDHVFGVQEILGVRFVEN